MSSLGLVVVEILIFVRMVMYEQTLVYIVTIFTTYRQSYYNQFIKRITDTLIFYVCLLFVQI